MTRPFPSGAVVPTLDGLVLTAAGVEAFDCPFCGDVRDLVVPDCRDATCGADHDECPDRACAQCGFALVLGSSHPDRVSGRGGSASTGSTAPTGATGSTVPTAPIRRAG